MEPLIQMEILVVDDVSALTQPPLKRWSFADLLFFLVRQTFGAKYLEITAWKFLLRKYTIFLVIFGQEVQTDSGVIWCTRMPIEAFKAV